MRQRPSPAVLLVASVWLFLPLLHQGSPAQDAIPLVVAADLLGDDAGHIYADEGEDLYDLDPVFREASCELYDDERACSEQAVAFISSPLALPVLAPLGWLSPDTAVVVVRFVGAAAMAAAFLAMVARLRPEDERLAVGLGLLLTFEVNHQVSLGQTSPLLFLAAALPLSRRRGWAGLALFALVVAACVSFKAFPIVLALPLVAARRWRELAAAAAAGLALVVAVLVVAPVSVWSDFVHVARDVQSASVENPYNAALPAVIHGFGGDGIEALGVVAGAALALAMVGRLRSATDDERWSAALPVALLVLPQVWGHYLPTALAFVVVVLHRRVERPNRAILVSVALLVPGSVLAGIDRDAPEYLLGYLLAALAATAALLARPPQPAGDGPGDRPAIEHLYR